MPPSPACSSDMTSQLIERTLKRVTGLREFLGTLGSHGAEMLPESDNEEIVALLGRVSMALAIQSLELRSVLRKAVSPAAFGKWRHRAVLACQYGTLVVAWIECGNTRAGCPE